MEKGLTHKQFLEKSKKSHGNKYNYTLVEYTYSNEKVKILCELHGLFTQVPSDHFRGHGCKKCSQIKSIFKLTENENKFIKKAKLVHNDNYNYNKVKYLNTSTKVIIHCKIHGEFLQTPCNHLSGHKCPICASKDTVTKNTKTQEDFITKCNKVHNFKYDYVKTNYLHHKKEIIITCKIHGDFIKKAYQHTFGSGCQKCSEIERLKKVTKDTIWFVEKSNKKHNFLYCYDNTNYVNSADKVNITCCIHGHFKQKPSDHMDGHGCPQCGNQSSWRRKEYIKKINGRVCLFYIIRCFNIEESFYKVGITCRDVKRRYNTVKSMPYNYEIISEIYGEAGEIWDIEKFEKIKLKEYKYNPKKWFAGAKTECFTKYKNNND